MRYLFGYVTPYKDELKIREYNVFRSYYCGLCKALGTEFNQGVRLGLNYDLTFLSLLLSCLDEEKDKIKAESCIANPIKKKPVIIQNPYIEYSAYMSIILVYFKLLDDWKDDHSFKALFAMLAYAMPVKKAKKRFPGQYVNIQKLLGQLSTLEKQKCSVIDEVADVFANLMKEIFLPPFVQEEETRRILGWLGYNLGRWIYILDAVDDIEKDAKHNKYNPVLLQYQYDHHEELTLFNKRIHEPILISLTYTLDNIAKSFELLNIKQHKNILDNIIYMGLRNKMESVVEKRSCYKNEKSL